MSSFDLKLPLILAPMGGGPGTPELAAAVSEAGGLGSLAGAYLSASELQNEIHRLRNLTKRPFVVNIFAPETKIEEVEDSLFHKALLATKTYRDELSLPDPTLPLANFEKIENQMRVILQEKPAALSFTFGLIPDNFIRDLKTQKILILGTATCLKEAKALEASGVDIIIAQGFEAGGHRGMFSQWDSEPALEVRPLTKLLSQNLDLPIVSAGGVMTGADMASCLDAGAQAVQMGTAFLLCPEAGTSSPYRKALQNLQYEETALTQMFSGRWARGLSNRFMREMDEKKDSLLPWPAQNFFTRDIRKRATQMEKSELLSLWVGTGHGKLRPLPARDLIQTLTQELALQKLAP